MAVITLYPNGSVCGVPPLKMNHKRGKRQKCKGWTKSVSRRQTKWLYSVEAPKLDGVGYSFTLTLRDCPKSATDLSKLQRYFTQWLRDNKAIRIHWLIEWQKRGVPHFHGCVYFPKTPENLSLSRKITAYWVKLTKHLGTQSKGQKVDLIRDILCWKKYLSKHGARGVDHYQRSDESRPKTWGSTGRMWGHIGEWPTSEIKLEVDQPGFYTYRRLLRSFVKANARKEKNPKQKSKNIRFSRTMLKCNERNLSSVRGVSQWINYHETLQLLQLVKEMGHEIKS
jgi:hypothetical protein